MVMATASAESVRVHAASKDDSATRLIARIQPAPITDSVRKAFASAKRAGPDKTAPLKINQPFHVFQPVPITVNSTRTPKNVTVNLNTAVTTVHLNFAISIAVRMADALMTNASAKTVGKVNSAIQSSATRDVMIMVSARTEHACALLVGTGSIALSKDVLEGKEA